MIKITYKRRNKYGCWFCADMVKRKDGEKFRCLCPHESCPYHKELDEYDSYEDFMEANSADPMFLKHLFALKRDKDEG